MNGGKLHWFDSLPRELKLVGIVYRHHIEHSRVRNSLGYNDNECSFCCPWANNEKNALRTVQPTFAHARCLRVQLRSIQAFTFQGTNMLPRQLHCLWKGMELSSDKLYKLHHRITLCFYPIE
jgi:hypothetical protein